MRARAVIGASFGDEGKGLMTDYLCQQGAGVVVRFNGGAQAGHTVFRPNGDRHVFHHFGSGSFCGVPTYLSQFFLINPIAFHREFIALEHLKPRVYAHPDCLITTFADMIINQELENKRGDRRHGSVGLGINETIERSQMPELKLTMADVWNEAKSIESKLKEICTKYAKFRLGKEIPNADEMIVFFLKGLSLIANDIHPLGIAQCRDIVFEGAQGLLLDQNNKENFPHVTRSNTGMQNVRFLMAQAGITEIETYYVSRSYLTKHGAGKLPGEDSTMRFHDDTNFDNEFQGELRFAPLDYDALLARCEKDFGSKNFKLVITHVDQLETDCERDLTSRGPTYKDVSYGSL